MDEKIKILNEAVGNKDRTYREPAKLYKYRPFDDYAFDMLENNYVFLCKASNLDDPTECKVTIDEGSYYDVANDCLRRTAVNRILETLRPYTSKGNFEQVKGIVYRILTPDFKVRRNFLIDASFELEKLVPDFNDGNMAPIVNRLANIPELLDKPEYGDQIKTLIAIGLDARDKMGICSLAESSNIEYMWENYASNGAGYCIEYDVTDYPESKNIFPVIYKESRDANIVFQVLDTFIMQLIELFSHNEITTDKSQFLRLFVTKDKIWEYQKEWRILGDADTKIAAPKITKIICGKNALSENKSRLKEYCRRNNIEFIEI